MEKSLDILASAIDGAHTEQNVLLAEFGPCGCRFNTGNVRFSYLIVDILVLDGVLRVDVDGIRYECSANKNNLLGIKPVNLVTRMEADGQFRGVLLAISRPFLDAAEKGNKPVPFKELLGMRPWHAMTLAPALMANLHDYFRILKDNTSLGDSKLDCSIFQHAVLLFHSKVIRTIIAPLQRERGMVRPSPRKLFLCERFFELLYQNVESRRDVEFYAGELCITPHYLSRITSEYVDLPASRVIAEELTARICRLLCNPDYTLSQIAERFNFFDQSSLGKFFRKHAGRSPAAYRREVMRRE